MLVPYFILMYKLTFLIYLLKNNIKHWKVLEEMDRSTSGSFQVNFALH